MSSFQLTADLGVGKEKYQVTLSLVEFKEDNVTIIYSPALDLTGYGYSPTEAKEAFSEALFEFFRYTRENNSLVKILDELGWTVAGPKNKLQPPKDSELVSSNPLYNEIVNRKAYKVSREEVEFTY